MTKKFEYSYVENYFKEYGYELLSEEYNGAMERLEVRCPEGHISNMTFMNFKVGHRCKRCSMKKFNERNKHSYKYVKEYIESYGYELVSDAYENINSKLLIKCPDGHIFDMSFKVFKRGNRCRYCNISNGEKKIKTFLEKQNIEFIEQYKFKDCKNKNVLPFDFYLPKQNCCIEFDGEQHFKAKDFFGGVKSFNEVKHRDKIKTLYCITNEIKLIRIPYWDFKDIEFILEDKLQIS